MGAAGCFSVRLYLLCYLGPGLEPCRALDHYKRKKPREVFKAGILGSVSARCHPVLTVVGMQHSKPEVNARWTWVGEVGSLQPVSHCRMEQEVNLWLTSTGDWCFLKNKASGAGGRQDHRSRGKVQTATDFSVPCGPKSFSPLEVTLQAGEKNSQEDVLIRLLTGLT